MRLIFPIVLLVMASTSANSARGKGAIEQQVWQDSLALSQLLSEVRAGLRFGWRAEITPDVPLEVMLPWRRDRDLPCLVVWYDKKVQGRRIAPGMPATSEDEESNWKPLRPIYQLTVTKFLTPAQYAEASSENARRLAMREKFYRESRGSLARDPYKGNFPPPPSYVNAKSDYEKAFVRRYALLWTRTMPRELPTHYFKTLAFVVDFDLIHFRDSAFARQSSDVHVALLSSLTAYEQLSNRRESQQNWRSIKKLGN